MYTHAPYPKELAKDTAEHRDALIAEGFSRDELEVLVQQFHAIAMCAYVGASGITINVDKRITTNNTLDVQQLAYQVAEYLRRTS